MGTMARPFLAIAAFAALAFACAPCAHAQDSFAARLAQDRIGDIEPGDYTAGDSVNFAIVPMNGNFMLRFDSSPEVFVLYSDRASLGGRVLKYDSGAVALQVSSWGGITLYTDAKPNGLPAVRSGDAPNFALPSVSPAQIQDAMQSNAEPLANSRHMAVSFGVDMTQVASSPYLRAQCFDALENAARGIDRFVSSSKARAAFAAKINQVQIAIGAKPTIALHSKTLVVTFNPDRGFTGRASSRAIARALATVLGVKPD